MEYLCKRKIKNGKKKRGCLFRQPLGGDPAGTRTQGPNIKSVVLYQLSYEISKECFKASFLLRDGKNTVP